MMNKEITLADAEWEVMNYLWDHPGATGKETCEFLEEKEGWKRSTTLTLISRLAAKGAVSEERSGKVKTFFPAIDREDIGIAETQSFLERVYQGSLSLMVSSLTRKQALSKEEVEELLALLKGGE